MAMHAYVINLDRAIDRWERTSAQLLKSGIPFERVSAVLGRDIQLPIPEFDEQSYRKRHGKKPNHGQIGCYLSHLKCLRLFLQSDHQFGIIVEDDVSISDNAGQVIDQAVQFSENWDVLRLCGFHNAHPMRYQRLESGTYIAVNLTRLCGTGAYLVTRRAAEVLSKALLPMSLPIDHAMDREWVYGLRASVLDPLPFNQEGHSLVSQLAPSASEKLPAWKRYWSVFPFRIGNESSRIFMRLKRRVVINWSLAKAE